MFCLTWMNAQDKFLAASFARACFASHIAYLGDRRIEIASRAGFSVAKIQMINSIFSSPAMYIPLFSTNNWLKNVDLKWWFCSSVPPDVGVWGVGWLVILRSSSCGGWHSAGLPHVTKSEEHLLWQMLTFQSNPISRKNEIQMERPSVNPIAM